MSKADVIHVQAYKAALARFGISKTAYFGHFGVHSRLFHLVDSPPFRVQRVQHRSVFVWLIHLPFWL